MLARENLYKIVAKTINNYNTNVDTTKYINYYTYPHLNAIVKNFRSKKIRDYIRTEYCVQGSFIKRIIVKLYLELVFIFPFMFNSKKLQLKFKGNERDDVLIYPCNQRLRVFYFDSNEVDVLVKDGFSTECNQNEIDFRDNYSLQFVPPILYVNSSYYRESIIDGIPLPRILDEDIKRGVKKNVINKILNFNKDNIEFISSEEYLTQLINFMLNKVSLIDDSLIFKKISDLINSIVSNSDLFKQKFDIPIVVSHGDLQHGNIWLERKTNNVLVFDWESVKKRSIWYDLYFLDAEKRKDVILDTDSLIDKSSVINNHYNVPISVISKIISLENIHYYIFSLSNFPKDILKVEMKSFVNKIKL